MSEEPAMKSPEPGRPRAFIAAAWAFLIYLVGVILFGAVVRITGSGAGCGEHWPDCNGQIVPMAPSMETMIEYGHRITSGLCGPLVLLLIVWAALRFGRRHRVFKAMIITAVFIGIEGAIGAGLVLKALVADDASVARAVVISLHLVNTLALTGSAALAAHWASGHALPRWSNITDRLKGRWLLLAGLVGLIAVSMSGAVTALGDTLFPIDPTHDGGLWARLQEGASASNHFLVRLRALHPLMAVGLACYLLYLGHYLREYFVDKVKACRLSWVLSATVIAQCFVGGFNVLLQAPAWLQLVHLASAQIVWVCALLMTVSAFEPVGIGFKNGQRQR